MTSDDTIEKLYDQVFKGTIGDDMALLTWYLNEAEARQRLGEAGVRDVDAAVLIEFAKTAVEMGLKLQHAATGDVGVKAFGDRLLHAVRDYLADQAEDSPDGGPTRPGGPEATAAGEHQSTAPTPMVESAMFA